MPHFLTSCIRRFCMAFALACMTLAFAGCSATQAFPKQAATSPAATSQTIAGRWTVEGSTATFTIRFINGAVHITGEDTDDGEAFVVTNTRWDGTTLEGDFLMPSTNWLTHSRLVLTDGNTLSGRYKDGSPEIWRRAP